MLLAEGLSGLIGRDIELGLLTSLMIGTFGLVISHLHYVNDTLILMELSIENLCTINAILKGFELAYGLR